MLFVELRGWTQRQQLHGRTRMKWDANLKGMTRSELSRIFRMDHDVQDGWTTQRFVTWLAHWSTEGVAGARLSAVRTWRKLCLTLTSAGHDLALAVRWLFSWHSTALQYWAPDSFRDIDVTRCGSFAASCNCRTAPTVFWLASINVHCCTEIWIKMTKGWCWCWNCF